MCGFGQPAESTHPGRIFPDQPENIMNTPVKSNKTRTTLNATSSPIVQAFGELELTFIDGSKMSEAWWDKGSGGKHSGAYYNPDFGQLGSDYGNFYFLGSFGMNSYRAPTGPMLLIRPSATASSSNPPIKAADDFTLIWKDDGTGAEQNGSMWLPTCKDPNYKPLGTYCVRHHDKPDPASSRIVLVRSDLVRTGSIGAFVWDDTDTGADKDFGSWEIDIESLFVDQSKMLIAPGCFVGVSSHKKPSSAAQANVLLLPIPSTHNDTPFVPKLSSPTEPSRYTTPDLADVVTVPFTAVVDKGLSLAQQIAESPFYTITRAEVYELAGFQVNDNSEKGSLTVTEATGISTTDSSTFSVSTGISVTTESGVSFLGTGGKVSATVSVELGYQTSTSVTEFQTKTISNQYTIPANSAIAVWTKFDQLTVVRMDGTPVSSSLEFRENSWVSSACPLG
jgi:hypothetical protein